MAGTHPPTPAEEDGARAAMPGGFGERPGVGETLLSTAPPQDCYLITEQLQTNYMMVTPKPRSGNGTAGCQIVHACTSAHTRTHTPHETLGALWSGDRTRQREEPGPREVTGSNPHCAGSVPQFPHLGLGIPLPAAALPLPRGIDTAPCRATPALPSAAEPPPAPQKHRRWLRLGKEHPHPTSPIPQPSPGLKRDAATESRSHGTGSWGSVLLRCPPASSWEPEQPRDLAPSRARAMVAPGPGPPRHPRDGTALLSATPNPPVSMCPGWLLTSKGTLTS